MGSIPETSRWEDEIYRIQTNDFVLGGQEGVINTQPTQLANRTLYLKNLLALEHDEQGRHAVTNDMVADDAAIPESKLDLDIPTTELQSAFTTANLALQRLRTEVAAILGDSGLQLDALSRLVQLNWHYGAFGYEFEFFTDNMTLRDARNVDSTRAIAYDDSVDCEDTTGFYPNMRCLLYDANHVEEVEIRSVLELGRIRLKDDIRTTFDDDTCYLGYTNWEIANGQATVHQGQLYYSKITSVLQNCSYGGLFICRDKGAGTLHVQYRDADGDLQWLDAECDGYFPVDHFDDLHYAHYVIEGDKVQLKIWCDSEEPVTVQHMGLLPQPFALMGSSIRTPHVLTPGADYRDAYQDLMLFESSEFLTAYRDYYVQTEYGLFDATTGELVHTYTIRQLQLTVLNNEEADYAPPGNYYVRCRHQSDVSEWSMWSKPVPLTLHMARVLFGFKNMPKGAKFNQGEFDRLDYYPIRFGFLGARLSAGFFAGDITTGPVGCKPVMFTTKLVD